MYNNASTDDSRPVLNAIQVTNTTSRSADGFRLVKVETPECLKQYAGKLVKFVKRPVMGLNELELVEGNFPECDPMFSHENHEISVSLNATLLINMLKDLPKDTCVSISLRKDSAGSFPVLFDTAARSELESNMVIMPMQLDGSITEL